MSLVEKLNEAARTPDASQRLIRVVAVLSQALSCSDVRPILVGGGAVEFYTAAAYQTADIDLVAPSYPAVEGIMRELGFDRRGKDFHHGGLDLYVEFPSAHLQPGETAIELDVDGVRVLVVSPEDLILDRLRAFVHWRSLRDGLNVLSLLTSSVEASLDRGHIEGLARAESLLAPWTELTSLTETAADLPDDALEESLRRILRRA